MKFELSKRILKEKSSKLFIEQNKLESMNPYSEGKLIPSKKLLEQQRIVERQKADVITHHNNLHQVNSIIPV